MLARTGTYHVTSRFIDDDAETYAGTSNLDRAASLFEQTESKLAYGRSRFPMDLQNWKGMVVTFSASLDIHPAVVVPHLCICTFLA